MDLHRIIMMFFCYSLTLFRPLTGNIYVCLCLCFKQRNRETRITNARDCGQLLEYDLNGNPKFPLDMVMSPLGLKVESGPSDEIFESKELSPGGPMDPPSAPTPSKQSADSARGKSRDKYEDCVLSEIADLKRMMSKDDGEGGRSILDASAVQELIERNEKNVARCAAYEERIRSLEASADDLRVQMEEGRSLSSKHEEEYNARLDEVKSECEEKTKEIKKLRQKLEESTTTTESEKEELVGRIFQLETQLNEKVKALGDLEWKIESMANDLEEAKLEAEQQREKISNCLEETSRQRLALELENGDLKKKIAKLTHDADQNIDSKMAEVKFEQERAASAEEKLANFHALVDKMKVDKEEAVKSIEKQRREEFSEKMSKLESEKASTEKILKETLSDLERLTAQADGVYKTVETLKEQKNSREEELLNIITDLEEKLSKAHTEEEQSIVERDNLKQCLASATQELESIKDQHEVAKKEISKEKKQTAMLSSQISEFDKMRKDLEQAKKHITILERENTTSKEKLSYLNCEKKDAEEKIAFLEMECDRMKGKTNGLQQNLSSAVKNMSQVESNMKMLQDEKENLAHRLVTFDEREASLIRKLILAEEKRRCLHNRVIQLAGNMRVFVRVRPVIDAEKKKSKGGAIAGSPFSFPDEDASREIFQSSSFGSVSSIDSVSNSTSSANDMTKNVIELTEPYKDRGGLSSRRKKWRYGFDSALGPSHGQEDVWAETEPLVQCAIDGSNVCLFAYGQTGSGKTYTMLGDSKNEGIIFRSVRMLFESKTSIEEASDGSTKVEISVEMLEIYNETVRDLLAKDMDEVKVKITSSAEPVIGNILMQVNKVDEVIDVISFAQSRRCVKSTNSNSESSRSHLVFTLHVKTIAEDKGTVQAGKLHICDLAGSERLAKSGSVGSTLTETKNINKSLSCLSNVIEKLQAGNSHVPYRDSKLTYLLKDSLGGDSKTGCIICCNPLPEHFNESLGSIRFAAKASRVELKAANSFSA